MGPPAGEQRAGAAEHGEGDGVQGHRGAVGQGGGAGKQPQGRQQPQEQPCLRHERGERRAPADHRDLHTIAGRARVTAT
ncbi:hypothetical protein C1J01_17395 [Nonomuraea aridisoli]|uniref:Uncharacterized protein n=1 Tax=Nonomuraea aridisoli TaxID=2070368 RepID=A0A2W2FRL1_9ACTN|nr:hypothetical protein C1J01_17395 [Nonomuraea aridisoli]